LGAAALVAVAALPRKLGIGIRAARRIRTADDIGRVLCLRTAHYRTEVVEARVQTLSDRPSGDTRFSDHRLSLCGACRESASEVAAHYRGPGSAYRQQIVV